MCVFYFQCVILSIITFFAFSIPNYMQRNNIMKIWCLFMIIFVIFHENVIFREPPFQNGGKKDDDHQFFLMGEFLDYRTLTYKLCQKMILKSLGSEWYPQSHYTYRRTWLYISKWPPSWIWAISNDDISKWMLPLNLAAKITYI